MARINFRNRWIRFVTVAIAVLALFGCRRESKIRMMSEDSGDLPDSVERETGILAAPIGGGRPLDKRTGQVPSPDANISANGVATESHHAIQGSSNLDEPIGASTDGPAYINPALVASAGIRRINGTHVTIYTDLPAAPEVDELPLVMAAAVPQWCTYFKIDPARATDWHLTGYIIQDRERFRSTGLLPDTLPPFRYGFQRGKEFWVYEQPSTYYRRHLMLHEATHGFMYDMLGSAGPSWYMEGIAELLGTHRWSDGVLTLGYFPKKKEEVPQWGRIKIVRDNFAVGHTPRLDQLFRIEPEQYYESVEAYAWSWAAAVFLDRHPEFRERFAKLSARVTEANFSADFQDELQDDWQQLSEQWQLMIVNLEYGYDVLREAVVYLEGKPLDSEMRVQIDAARGWQSSGVELQQGMSYEVQASKATVRLLVATDVVGRGIDVTAISHIINYDVPHFSDDYIHRVGRTGRMGREGVAFTFVTPEEGNELTRIEIRINRQLKRDEISGFEATGDPESPTATVSDQASPGDKPAAEDPPPPPPRRGRGPRRHRRGL